MLSLDQSNDTGLGTEVAHPISVQPQPLSHNIVYSHYRRVCWGITEVTCKEAEACVTRTVVAYTIDNYPCVTVKKSTSAAQSCRSWVTKIKSRVGSLVFFGALLKLQFIIEQASRKYSLLMIWKWKWYTMNWG